MQKHIKTELVAIIIWFVAVLPGCRTEVDCSPPGLNDVAQSMVSCLPAQASSEEAQVQLEQWAYEGEAFSANVLPGSAAPELVLTYRANLQPYDPQGKLAVLERSGNKWQVVFESPAPQAEPDLNGRETLAGNWWFDLDQIADLQGNGRESVLFHQQWSDMMNTSVTFTKLLTAVDDAVGVLLVEGDFDDHRPTYRVAGPYIYSQSNFGKGVAITRTLALDGGGFVQTAETINPAAAELHITLADGTQFISYDSECGWLCYHRYGLYRIRNGEQFHYDTPIFIRSLKQLRDGEVYIGSSEILRVVGDELQPITSDFAPLPAGHIWQVGDMAMSNDGEIWAAGWFSLLHFGHEKSEVYDLITSNVTVAPDDSVWALGWDGLAESNCCVFHVHEGNVITYQRGAELPISKELAVQIYADR